MKIKVAGIQMSCVDDRGENLKKAERLGEMAVGNGARIVCYQPLFNSLWFPSSEDESRFRLAEGREGPTLERMRALAEQHGICVVAPLFEKADDGCFYTAFVVGGKGEIMGSYRKVHLPDIPLWREKFYFKPGDAGYPVLEYEGLRFGVQICWDNFFPEGARILALGGASLIFAPTAAAFLSYQKWETVMVASAVANGLYLMRVNRVGREAGQDFYGRSFCVDPEGEFIIDPVGLNDGVVVAELDTERIATVRREWNFLAGRRPETYGPIVCRP